MKLFLHFFCFIVFLFCSPHTLLAQPQDANTFFVAQIFEQHKLASPGLIQKIFKANFDGNLSPVYNACEQGIAAALSEDKKRSFPQTVSKSALASVYKYKNALQRYAEEVDEMPRELLLSFAFPLAPNMNSLISCEAKLKKKERSRDFRISVYTEATCLLSTTSTAMAKKEKSLAQAVHVSEEEAFQISSRKSCFDAVKRLVKIK